MVLIINSSKRKARAIGDIFYYMGIPSYAATPDEALSEISCLYRAALVIDPEDLPDTESFIEKLRSYSSLMPVFAITDSISDRYRGLFDMVLPSDIYSSKLVEEIVRFQKQRSLPLTSQYKLAGIDASCDTETVSVFDRSVAFTNTETMILRYLIISYPIPQDSKSILRYAFKPLRKPEPTSIRTHVSVMNKKFRETRGKNLIVAVPSEGYVISTPEVLKSFKEAN